ncbi:alanine dehydrogenase [Neolewinella agarilytica]|uniref:alanine dehydrogenase n=1 Tax=Neolewinella agarilytica TaxID=478744 RepID=A0A1H9GEI9_9BACT|nr:alanine dehydrogenase [Neolewinella agarilytica]SEQ48521.1 alanine dehydrogenase [Neolewinella agarilytica]
MSSKDKKKVSLPEELTSGYGQTQTETLAVQHKQESLFIGIPKEITLQEKRVALVPSGVANLTSRGHRVLVETGAGIQSNFTDHSFSEQGGEIAYSAQEVYEKAKVILKVAPPTLDEIEMMQPGTVLISPLQLPTISAEYLYRLKNKRIIALAMEYMQDEEGSFPIVRIMSEMAGISAVQTAAELLSTTTGGPGVLLGGVSGVPSAKVVILGGGVVAEFATRAALGMGAEVRIFDDNIHKLMRLQNSVGRQLYTSAMNPYYLRKELLSAEVAIGAIHAEHGRTPIVVSEEMVRSMRPGSVIIDVSIDQGGCFATSEMTTLQKPTFRKHDVIHYCVPNLASRVGRTASIAVNNILVPLLLRADGARSFEHFILRQAGLRHGVYTFRGCLTNPYLGKRFDMRCTDIDLLMTSGL